jgi:putative ABC transport system substrate-binding protein
MNRNTIKILVGLLASFILTTTSLAGAQPAKKMPRIGWLSAGSSSAEFPEKQVLEGLRRLDWVDGKNVVIEYRHAAGNPERLSQFASELVGLKVDVIVTFSAG